MKQFYEVHRGDSTRTMVRVLLWTHNLFILSQSKGSEEREFYLKLAVKTLYNQDTIWDLFRALVHKEEDPRAVPEPNLDSVPVLPFLEPPNQFGGFSLAAARRAAGLYCSGQRSLYDALLPNNLAFHLIPLRHLGHGSEPSSRRAPHFSQTTTALLRQRL
jgi:hypothetical protein